MRAVVDTSVWISGVFWTGLPHQLLLRWRNGEFEAVLSPALMAELSRVLHAIAREIGAASELADEWADLIALGAEVAIPAEKVAVCRDPDDNAVLEAALAGRVDCIVSGDKDLLDLCECGSIPIITPRRFMSLLDANE
jgi:putative PIN family toxin of toxin-antitoxin system